MTRTRPIAVLASVAVISLVGLAVAACGGGAAATASPPSYHEIACLVSGRGSSAVVVAAAPTALWDQQAGTLERAVSSFVA